MNVLVATDGSKYGGWALNWAAKLPFVKPPQVTALQVLDHAWLRLPFRTKVEIQRVEARSERILKKVTEQLALLKLMGTACKEQGSVVTTILKHTPKRDGLMVVGSQGLDFLDRFTIGSVSTKLIQHATCPVLVFIQFTKAAASNQVTNPAGWLPAHTPAVTPVRPEAVALVIWS